MSLSNNSTVKTENSQLNSCGKTKKDGRKEFQLKILENEIQKDVEKANLYTLI